MRSSTVEAVLETIQKQKPFSPACEITLEANPSSITREQMQDFQAAGVNRLSIGVQAFDDKLLKALGRDHTASVAIKCLTDAAVIFPDRFSVDLMFGLPNTTMPIWLEQLQSAIQHRPRHMSIYELTYKRGTMLFNDVAAKRLKPLDPDLLADMFSVTDSTLSAAGLTKYETSSYAVAGHEGRHNILGNIPSHPLSFWRQAYSAAECADILSQVGWVAISLVAARAHMAVIMKRMEGVRVLS